MSRSVTAILACTLLVLALAPWIVSSCASQPLMPESLVQERTYYEATVDMARTATRVAERMGDSDRRVVVIGTVPATATATRLAPPAQITRTDPASLVITGTAQLAVLPTDTPLRSPTPTASPTATKTPTPRPSSTVTIRIAPDGPTPTATIRIIVVQPTMRRPCPWSPPLLLLLPRQRTKWRRRSAHH